MTSSGTGSEAFSLRGRRCCFDGGQKKREMKKSLLLLPLLVPSLLLLLLFLPADPADPRRRFRQLHSCTETCGHRRRR